jgi:putative GTP pyrophosphokinase
VVDQSDIETKAEIARSWYSGYVYKCRLFEQRFVAHLTRHLRQSGIEGKLESRTKSIDSLVAKAVKLTPRGDFKYADPRTEITDFVGARIEVPLSTDLPAVVAALSTGYTITEELEKGSEEGSLDTPGYRSLHFLVRLNADAQNDVELREFADMVVEVQVRTTLQHAWASLQHDLVYKTERTPTPAIKRRLVALAGLLELADREFVSVRQAHSEIGDVAPPDAELLSGKLTASGLRHLAEQIFGEEDVSPQVWYLELKASFDKLGLMSGQDLDEALGVWRSRAPEVAAQVRLTKPWVNLAYLLDLLVRLGMKERYVDLIPPDDEEKATAEEMRLLRESFLSELGEFEMALGQS